MTTTKMFVLGEVKALEDDDETPTGGFDVILSTPSLDRDGEILDAKIFEPLPEHITFDIDHGMSTATTVGSGTPYYDEQDRLRVRGTFASIPRAQEVRTLVREGHIRTTSVAFMGAEREEKDDGVHITKAELLNGAFVAIPSNRDALVLSAKSYAEQLAAADPLPTLCAKCAQPTDPTAAPAGAPADDSAGATPAQLVTAAARLRARHALETL
jgi:hypothetical protein